MLKINSIPYEPSGPGGRFIYHKTNKDDYKRIQRAPKSERAFLLNEAIRFYNYGIDRFFSTVKKDEKDWPLFDETTLPAAIEELSNTYRQSIVNLITKLYTNISTHLKESARKENPWAISANRGLLCAHLLISKSFRNESKVMALKKKPHLVYFREFEDLTGSLKKLQEIVRRSSIEKSLRDKYSKFLSRSAKVDEFFFEPCWGGSYIIKPGGASKSGFPFPWDDKKPILPHQPHEVGPTEKLYFSISSAVFEDVHKQDTHWRRKRKERPFNWLTEVDEKISIIEGILPPLTIRGQKYEKIWQQWQDNLEYLEFFFEQAMRLKYMDFELGIDQHPGVILGLPAALGLIGILRAYIAELRSRVFMVSLKRAILEIYEDINGYLAVALWEALSDNDAVGVTNPGCLRRWGLVGELKSWHSAVTSDVRKSECPANEAANKTLTKLWNEPLIKEEIHNNSRSHKKQEPTLTEDVNFCDFNEKYLPRHPPITGAFYKTLSNKKNESDLLYGARFTSQAHIFIAFQMLFKANEILDWDSNNRLGEARWEETQPGAPIRHIKKRHQLKTFNISAGSYVWGGKKPPHNTHRHGVNFDFNFGPDIIPWPMSIYQDKIEKFKAVKGNKRKNIKSGWEIIKEIIGKGPEEFKVLRYSTKPVVVCYTMKHVAQGKGKVTGQRKIIFRRLMKNVIDIELKKLKKCCDKTIETGSFYNDDEKKLYVEAEKNVAGTPHFLSLEDSKSLPIDDKDRTEPGDWQRTHAGHLAIMLSAPEQIIFASPIVHLRAMRALRETFGRGDIELFKVGAKQETEKSLDNGEIPDELVQLFEENKLPLSDNAFIPEKKPAKNWVIDDNTFYFTVRKDNDVLAVTYNLPVEVILLGASIIKDVGFVFLPHNHHDHWHVDYHRWEAIGKFYRYSRLWLALGVDLTPFLAYLKNYEIIDESNKLLQDVVQEKYKLIEACKEYINLYNSKFGTPSAQDKNELSKDQIKNKTIANKLIYMLFINFKKDSPFMEPAVKKDYVINSCNAKPVCEIIKKSTNILKAITPRLADKELINPGEFDDYTWGEMTGLFDFDEGEDETEEEND